MAKTFVDWYCGKRIGELGDFAPESRKAKVREIAEGKMRWMRKFFKDGSAPEEEDGFGEHLYGGWQMSGDFDFADEKNTPMSCYVDYAKKKRIPKKYRFFDIDEGVFYGDYEDFTAAYADASGGEYAYAELCFVEPKDTDEWDGGGPGFLVPGWIADEIVVVPYMLTLRVRVRSSARAPYTEWTGDEICGTPFRWLRLKLEKHPELTIGGAYDIYTKYLDEPVSLEEFLKRVLTPEELGRIVDGEDLHSVALDMLQPNSIRRRKRALDSASADETR